MGFQPKDMPQPFQKNNSSNSTYRKIYFDRLITVKGYNVNQSIMLAQDDDGRNLEIHVSKDAIDRNRKAEAENPKSAEAARNAKWVGYAIDERMAKNLTEGSRVILERAFMSNKMKKNNEEVYAYEANRIFNVTEPSPEKTFEGLFSIAVYENRVFNVQHWNEKAIDIGDDEALNKLREDIQKSQDAYQNKESQPTVGVQFRVLQPKGDGYEVIDTSATFDWISRVKDDAGNEVAPGSPLTVQRFDELIEGYGGYVSETFPQEEYPVLLLEIITYKNYMASSMSRSLVLSENQYSPLNQLSNVSTKLAIKDENFIQGKNYAVKGVLQLTGDKIEKTVKGMEISPRNIVTRLHANGIKGNVQSFVRAADGKTCRPHEALKNVLNNIATPGEKTAVETSGGVVAPTQTVASSQTSSSVDGAPTDAWGGDDTSGSGWDSTDEADPFAEQTTSTATFGRKKTT